MVEKVIEKIKRLEQTCHGCPSQWEGETYSGKKVYIRYRWGCLNIGIGDDPLGKDYGNTCSIASGELVDGVIDIKKVEELTNDVIDWSDYTLVDNVL